MADQNIDIKTKAKKVTNEKSAEQDSELAELKKKKAEADTKAKEKQKEIAETKAKEKEAAALKEKKQQEEKENTKVSTEQVAAIAASAAGLIGTAAKKNKSIKSLVIGIIIGLIGGFLLSSVLLNNGGSDPISSEEISDSVMTHTELDFESVILGEAQEHQELIVMEQPLEVSTTITKFGLGNLDIFSKVKDVTYTGKGQYTVDMSGIDKEHIDVDNENKVVKITIPHTVLQEVILDVNNIQFEDTEKGLLSFGELSLTPEQQNKIEVSVRETMKETLDSEELFAQADEFASLKTWQIFQPLVTSVSPEYVVEMVIE